MPRRNKRHEVYEPLDLTPEEVRRQPPPKPSRYVDPAVVRRQRAERERERIERQRNARINHGIDWGVCLVPGCGEALTHILGGLQHHDPDQRDHTTALPLCFNHLGVAYRQASLEANDPLMVQAVTLAIERKEAKRQELDDQNKRAWLARTEGHIYFVRLNGLVKVGWSRDVDQRLRAYGPDVEVLAIYEGTRDDETNLHRQLRPALARGREWYEDGKVIADFVAAAVEKHGPPVIYDGWTRPKEVIKLRRRSA